MPNADKVRRNKRVAHADKESIPDFPPSSCSHCCHRRRTRWQITSVYRVRRAAQPRPSIAEAIGEMETSMTDRHCEVCQKPVRPSYAAGCVTWHPGNAPICPDRYSRRPEPNCPGLTFPHITGPQPCPQAPVAERPIVLPPEIQGGARCPFSNVGRPFPSYLSVPKKPVTKPIGHARKCTKRQIMAEP